MIDNLSSHAVVFFVPGDPATKGSHKAVVRGGRAILINDNPKEAGWRQRVALVASDAMGGRPLLEAAVYLEVTFTRQRPKGHLSSKGAVKPRYAAALPSTKPDFDKLARSVADSLNGVVWRDDALVTTSLIRKRWGVAGVQVLVRLDEGAC